MRAIISGHAGVTRLLLVHTVDLDISARERNDMTLLHEAVDSGKLDHRGIPHQLWCRHKYPRLPGVVTTARSITNSKIRVISVQGRRGCKYSEQSTMSSTHPLHEAVKPRKVRHRSLCSSAAVVQNLDTQRIRSWENPTLRSFFSKTVRTDVDVRNEHNCGS